MSIYRQNIIQRLVVAMNNICILADYPDASDEEKALIIAVKQSVRQELIDLAAKAPTPIKKKKSSPFDTSRYKTHEGVKGSPEKWREAAKIIFEVNNENCLTTLGLSGVPSTEAELKTAYRAAIRKCHPDLGGSEDEAAKLNAAYELALTLFFTKPDVNSKEARKDTGLRPQLLTPIDEQDAGKYIANPLWCAQEKMDGKHIILKKVGDKLTISNKQGLETTIPEVTKATFLERFSNLDVTLDGELIGNKFYVFDLLEISGQQRLFSDFNYRIHNYKIRYDMIKEILPQPVNNLLFAVPAYFTAAEKESFFTLMQVQGKEGVVFKKIDVPFTEGRPETGGDMVKCKFWATLSAIVDTQDTGKSSFITYVFDEKGQKVNMGRCSALGKVMPQPGEIVELKYLYVGAGGKLIQQNLIGIRDDVDPSECTTKQLKYKAE